MVKKYGRAWFDVADVKAIKTSLFDASIYLVFLKSIDTGSVAFIDIPEADAVRLIAELPIKDESERG